MSNHQTTKRFRTWDVKDKFMQGLHRGEKGFTLMELLIVLAILGIIAAVVIPSGAGLMTSGVLNAAQTEAEHVKTAAAGYVGEYGGWPDSSDDVGFFFEGDSDALKATYHFGSDGIIDSVSDQEWEDIHWDVDSQTWTRGETVETPTPPGPTPLPPGPVPIPVPFPTIPVPFR
jgi:prepilin-type N-terminal cleavage/methylation domain-containing protein